MMTFHEKEERDGVPGHTPLVKRRGARLPHWTQKGAVYSVTFRLADSVPQHVLEAWVHERERLLNAARKQDRPLRPEELRRIEELHSERVDSYLNAGHGAC